MRKGIDVSSYQGKPEWNKVKAVGVEFAILRVANRKGIDSSFEYNYKGCEANSIPVGVYKYSYALSEQEAIAEANEVIRILNRRELELGVWLDLEWDQQRALGKPAITKIANAFIEAIKSSGYQFGIYCNHDWYKNVLDTQALDYTYWIARYPTSKAINIAEYPDASKQPNVNHTLFGWQYSSKGIVPGITGNVDLDISDLNIEDDGTHDDKLEQSYPVEITASSLYIRSGAGKQYPDVGMIPQGARVVIIEQQSGWGRIDNCNGWICLSYTRKL